MANTPNQGLYRALSQEQASVPILQTHFFMNGQLLASFCLNNEHQVSSVPTQEFVSVKECLNFYRNQLDCLFRCVHSEGSEHRVKYVTHPAQLSRLSSVLSVQILTGRPSELVFNQACHCFIQTKANHRIDLVYQAESIAKRIEPHFLGDGSLLCQFVELDGTLYFVHGWRGKRLKSRHFHTVTNFFKRPPQKAATSRAETDRGQTPAEVNSLFLEVLAKTNARLRKQPNQDFDRLINEEREKIMELVCTQGDQVVPLETERMAETARVSTISATPVPASAKFSPVQLTRTRTFVFVNPPQKPKLKVAKPQSLEAFCRERKKQLISKLGSARLPLLSKHPASQYSTCYKPLRLLTKR